MSLVGASIMEARKPSLTSSSTSARTAREKPHSSAFKFAFNINWMASASSAETRGNPASIRLTPQLVQLASDVHLLLGGENNTHRLLTVAKRGVVETDGFGNAERISGRELRSLTQIWEFVIMVETCWRIWACKLVAGGMPT